MRSTLKRLDANLSALLNSGEEVTVCATVGDVTMQVEQYENPFDHTLFWIYGDKAKRNSGDVQDLQYIHTELFDRDVVFEWLDGEGFDPATAIWRIEGGRVSNLQR